VRFAISIPQLDRDGFDAVGVKEYLSRAEELGFEAGWVMEQVVGHTPMTRRWSCWRTPPPAPSACGWASPSW
jgi:hypothetical protein